MHAAIKAEFAGNPGVRIGPIVEQPSAVHVTPQFETSFTKPNLVDVLPWLMFNRPEGFSVLLHPFTAELVSEAHFMRGSCMHHALQLCLANCVHTLLF